MAGLQTLFSKLRDPSLREPLVQSVQKERTPFSRKNCIMWPAKAADHTKSCPYATLKVTVGQAVGLLNDSSVNEAGDFLNPYVFMTLDDDETLPTYRTKTVWNNEAPQWNTEFVIEIYHPMSILTLQVFDNDTNIDADAGNLEDTAAMALGAVKAAAANIAVVRGEDDHIGFIDFYVSVLPKNTCVEGWFNLIHPEHYEDSLKARMRDSDSHIPLKTSGRIKLDMELVINSSLDEFCAMCLYAPSLGHGLLALDLDVLYDDVQRFSAQQKVVKQKVKIWATTVEKWSTPICIFTIVALWNRYFIIPFLLFVLFISVNAFSDFHEHVETKGFLKETVDNAARGLFLGPLIAASNSNMKKQDKQSLRNFHKWLKKCHKLLEKIEKVIDHPWEYLFIPMGVLLLVLHFCNEAILFYILTYSPYIIKILLTVTVISWSFVGRAIRGLHFTCWKHPHTACMEEENERENTEDEETGEVQMRASKSGIFNRLGFVHAATTSARIEGIGQHNQKRHSTKCKLHLSADLQQNLVATGNEDIAHKVAEHGAKHQWVKHVLYTPRWCSKSCGRFIWTTHHEARKCAVCHRIVCASCAHIQSDDCVGDPKIEAMNTTTCVQDFAGSMGRHLGIKDCYCCAHSALDTVDMSVVAEEAHNSSRGGRFFHWSPYATPRREGETQSVPVATFAGRDRDVRYVR